MKKIQKRSLGAILILLMLGTSPISITYSFAEIDPIQDKKEQNYSQIHEDFDQKIILTQQVVDGKLEVRQYSLPKDAIEEDLQRRLSFDGQKSNWVYVNSKAYHSGIVLFDGKVSKVGDNLWRISIIETDLREKHHDFEYAKKFDRTHQSESSEELDYRVVFSGKIAEAEDQSMFAINLMNAGLKNTEMGQNIKNLQFMEMTMNLEKSIQPIKNSEIQYR